MADPVTWITIASTAFSAIGAISQANTASANAKAQANAANYNAEVSRQQAESAQQVSTQQQLAHARQARQVLGAQRAGVAQSGTGFGGSNKDILEQSGTLAELDQLNIAYEGDLRARGFQSQAALDTYQAQVSNTNASRAKTAGYLGAGAALATGAKSIFSTGGSSVIGSGLRPGGGLGLRPRY